MTTIDNPGGALIPALILNDPGPLVECRASLLSWEGNIGDTGILVYMDHTIPEGNPLEFLPIVPGALTETTWLVDQPGGSNYTLLLHDSTAAASTVYVSVALNPDGDTSCDRKDQQLDSTVSGGPSTPSGTVQPTSNPSTTSAQSSVGPSSTGGTASIGLPPTLSVTGLPSTDIFPTQTSSSVSDHHHHASVVGPIVGAVCGLLIVGGIGGLLYMRRRKRIRMRDSERPTSGEIHAFPVPSPVPKRPLVIMEAEPPLASLREENNVLGEENAVLRAVIARMQTSLPAPGDSETLPSYESRPVRSQ